MASILSVEQLRGLSSGDNPNTITLPAGQILDITNWSPPTGTAVQTAQSAMTGGTITMSSTSWTSTGHELSFTPQYANSNFRVELQNGGWYDMGNSNSSLFISFESNESGSYAHLTGINTTYGLLRMSGDGNTWNIKPYSATWYYTPTYTLGNTIIFRVVGKTNGQNSHYSASDRGDPVITITEIAG